ncbi:MAPEG family protein [Shimia ponticola]|uniref:MAPEG family protein n=1 Tax=Shimia ponticola TaxID=2582893 RepID=UPI0011BE0600|nr:MAPEG family protein [Shimia ponticola]
MTPELFWLTLTMLLAATMWLPFIIGVNTTESGQQVTKDGRANIPEMVPWVQRANRAHLNLVEQAMPFAALVLLAHVLDVTSGVTVGAAIAFFWLRLAHAVFMITSANQIPIRPIIFTLAWLCPMAVGIEILRLV